jgi:iron complex outermembrane receptor protein
MKTGLFWPCASLMALCWSGAASAQPGTSEEAVAAASEASADEGEIVVTAQRRSENLMRTAISASVISGTDLANKGVVNVDALQFATPSLVVNNFGQGNDFNVRGIGKAEHNTQTTTGVITYRDGVPTFPGYFQQEPYFDVANIQVLRGPQGTIVGQNATGGAVFVNTNDPVIGGGVHGYFQVQGGNYDDLGAQGAINLPVSDTLAMRIAFFGERRDGFYRITGPGGAKYTGNNGDLREAAARISLLWKPTDRLSVLFKTDLDYLDMGAYPADPYTNRFRFLPYGSTTPNPNYRDLFDITANSPQGAKDKFFRSILRLEYGLGGGVKFRSVSGYSKGRGFYLADLDGTSANISTFGDTLTEKQFSQEFNLISPDNGRFTWLLGAFGLWNKYNFLAPYKLFIGLPGFGIPNYYDLQGTNPQRALAGFAQVGFRITPSLKLDLGGRYTDTRTTNHVLIRQFGSIVTPQEQTEKSDNFSYKVSLGWEVNPSHFLYGFVATGFRPGGLNTPVVGSGVIPPFGPETVRSFEAGWKANFLGGKIRTTVDGFYNQYRHFQAILGRPDNPRLTTELNVSGTTKIYGGEAEADLNLGALSLSAGVNWLHSSLGRFFAVDPRNLPPATPAPGLCNPSTGPATPYCINLTGRRQTYAPNFTFNLAAEYRIDLGSGATLTPRANFGHIGAQWATLFERPNLGDRLEDRNILNAQLAFNKGGWTVTAYATNLTTQHYVGALNSGLNFAGPPRQYGVRLLKTF